MICTACNTQNSATSGFCITCGTKLEAAAPATAAPATPTLPAPSPFILPPKKKLSTGAIVGIIAGALVILLGAGLGTSAVVTAALNSNSADTLTPDYSDTTDSTDSGTDWVDTPVTTDWAPSDYTQWDDYLAYKWVTDNYESDCYDCTYWFLEVIAHYDCSNGIYGEITMDDSYGNQVDWSNDSYPSLYANQTAVFEFDHYPYEADMTGTLTTLTCHE